jgi:hypothetical protein
VSYRFCRTIIWLNVGDLAEFSNCQEEKIGKNTNTEPTHTGIIVHIDKRCSEGEHTYTALCEDGKIRFFIMEEAKKLISKL